MQYIVILHFTVHTLQFCILPMTVTDTDVSRNTCTSPKYIGVFVIYSCITNILQQPEPAGMAMQKFINC